MSPTKEHNFIRTAYRLFIIGKFFGVSCFTIKKDNIKNHKYTEATRCDVTMLFGFLTMLLFVAYENFVNPKNMSNDENERIFNLTSQFIIGVSPIVCITAILRAFMDREKLWTVIFDMRSIDKRVISV